jgi:hypothetical protein
MKKFYYLGSLFIENAIYLLDSNINLALTVFVSGFFNLLINFIDLNRTSIKIN